MCRTDIYCYSHYCINFLITVSAKKNLEGGCAFPHPNPSPIPTLPFPSPMCCSPCLYVAPHLTAAVTCLFARREAWLVRLWTWPSSLWTPSRPGSRAAEGSGPLEGSGGSTPASSLLRPPPPPQVCGHAPLCDHASPTLTDPVTHLL